MNGPDFVAILPLMVVAASALAVLVALSVRRSHAVTLGLTLVGLLTALGLMAVAAIVVPRHVTSLLIIDRYAIFFMGLVCATSAAVALLAHDYWRKHGDTPEEFYVLLLFASLGAMTLASAEHFISLFLGLETLSVSLYAMIAYRRADPLGTEAGVKYLILAAASSAVMLFGMALAYAEYGTMSLAGLVADVAAQQQLTPVVMTAVAMILVGFTFKLALVPFHLWTPDIYQGSPSPTTAFIATVSKGAALALVIRYFGPDSPIHQSLVPLFFALSLASMFAGNLLALRQRDVARILAYSSIAHMGYLMVALVAGGPNGATAMTFYLITYFAAILAAFGVLGLLSEKGGRPLRLRDLEGLAWHRPWLALVLGSAMFSLAGIPVTAGFVGKFYVLSTGVASGSWWLVFGLIVSSAIGLYYYLRVIVVTCAFSAPRSEVPSGPRGFVRPGGGTLTATVALTAAVLALVWIGLYPVPILNLVKLCVGLP